jgi:16S rRNA (uracil1498-N3)-methyltransferase
MDFYRFFAPDIRRPEIELLEDQSHHARHVLRLETGAAVILFDGRGNWARGTLRVEKRAVFAEVAGEVITDPPARVQLTVATAVPKADRAEWLIEQASQLGAAAVQWLETDRGVVKPKEAGGGKMEKFRRLAIESAKQCGRTHVMDVAPMQTLATVLGAGKWDATLWLEPHGGKSVAECALPAEGRVLALVGPEGGWSERELAVLEKAAGIQRVRLTATILRIETACAAVAALVMAR